MYIPLNMKFFKRAILRNLLNCTCTLTVLSLMLIGFHFSNEICQMSTILQLKDIPWGKEILEIVYNSQGKFQVPDFWELFWIPQRLKMPSTMYFLWNCLFKKCILARLLECCWIMDLNWWMSEEMKELVGGWGGDRGWVWASIMENCAIDHHHLIIMRYLQKTFMIIADVIIIIIIIITVIITAALSSSCTYIWL